MLYLPKNSLPFMTSESSLPCLQNPALESILGEMNPIHIPCFFKIYLSTGTFFFKWLHISHDSLNILHDCRQSSNCHYSFAMSRGPHVLVKCIAVNIKLLHTTFEIRYCQLFVVSAVALSCVKKSYVLS